MTPYFGRYLRNVAVLSSLVLPLACTSCKKDNNVPVLSFSFIIY